MRCGIHLVFALSLTFGGCGDGGGDPASAPTPSATVRATAVPTRMVVATATFVPTPASTATPDASFQEVVLAAATKYGIDLPHGGRAAQQFVLRNDGGGWEATLLSPMSLATSVFGVTFASESVAFAFGGYGEGAISVLLRSDDTGRTWRDVSGALPPECPQIFDAAFADANRGWIVARSTFTIPVVFATVDGGASWREVPLPPSPGFPLYGSYAFGLRGAVELARYDGGGLQLVRLDDPSVAPLILEPSGGASFPGANGFATAGPEGWIAESYTASILRSAAPGEPWRQQVIRDVGASELRSIDVRDERHGVAGGTTLGALTGRTPLLLVTDDGATWHPAVIEETFDGWAVIDALRLRGDGAVATVTNITSGDSATALLRSQDGGRTWRRDPTRFEHDWDIHDLARNTRGR